VEIVPDIPGRWQAQLTVTDSNGLKGTDKTKIGKTTVIPDLSVSLSDPVFQDGKYKQFKATVSCKWKNFVGKFGLKLYGDGALLSQKSPNEVGEVTIRRNRSIDLPVHCSWALPMGQIDPKTQLPVKHSATVELSKIMRKGTSDYGDANAANNKATITVGTTGSALQPQLADAPQTAARAANPDLKITGIKPSTRNARVGDTLSFTVSVKNDGKKDARDVTVLLSERDPRQRWYDKETIGSIPAGKGTQVTLKLACGPNRVSKTRHKFIAIVDPGRDGGAIAESNEKKNRYSDIPSVMVRRKESDVTSGKPDLRITRVRPSTRKAREGDTLSFTVYVKNDGKKRAKNVSVVLSDRKERWYDMGKIRSVPADKEAEITLNLACGPKQVSKKPHKFIAMVDPGRDGGAIAESNEENNRYSDIPSVIVRLRKPQMSTGKPDLTKSKELRRLRDRLIRPRP